MSAERPFLIKAGNGSLAAVLHEAGADRIVILSHGFTGTKVESGRLFVTLARELARSGITALRFDFMGSGDSSGEFYEMSPNTEIADLIDVISWARRKKYQRLGLLGMSLGGAISICAAARSPAVRALVTLSAVPHFETWRSEPDQPFVKDPMRPGRKFFDDRPEVDVPQAYCSLRIPKLQIQGDADLPGFRETFAGYFSRAKKPKRHVVLPGADHVFTDWRHRRKVIVLAVDWFARHL
jgi:pimeloyl-ACP methyl ester carboxylesterase